MGTAQQSSPVGLKGCSGLQHKYSGSLTEWLHNNPDTLVLATYVTYVSFVAYCDTSGTIHHASQVEGPYTPAKDNVISGAYACVQLIGPK